MLSVIIASLVACAPTDGGMAACGEPVSEALSPAPLLTAEPQDAALEQEPATPRATASATDNPETRELEREAERRALLPKPPKPPRRSELRVSPSDAKGEPGKWGPIVGVGVAALVTGPSAGTSSTPYLVGKLGVRRFSEELPFAGGLAMEATLGAHSAVGVSVLGDVLFRHRPSVVPALRLGVAATPILRFGGSPQPAVGVRASASAALFIPGFWIGAPDGAKAASELPAALGAAAFEGLLRGGPLGLLVAPAIILGLLLPFELQLSHDAMADGRSSTWVMASLGF